MSVAETLGLMLGFGMLIISLLNLILMIYRDNDKNNRP